MPYLDIITFISLVIVQGTGHPSSHRVIQEWPGPEGNAEAGVGVSLLGRKNFFHPHKLTPSPRPYQALPAAEDGPSERALFLCPSPGSSGGPELRNDLASSLPTLLLMGAGSLFSF